MILERGIETEMGHEGPASIWFSDPATPPMPFVLEDAVRSDAGFVVSTLVRAGYGVEFAIGKGFRKICGEIVLLRRSGTRIEVDLQAAIR